jgi:hypothetical protein
MLPTYVEIEDNAVLTRIFARMPAHMQHSFTPEQLEALGHATYDAPTPHAVAIRKTLRLFGTRYYLAIFMGRDRRGRPEDTVDLTEEFRADWRYLAVSVVLLAAVAALIYVLGWAFWSSVAKSIGGEISAAPATLHEFFVR